MIPHRPLRAHDLATELATELAAPQTFQAFGMNSELLDCREDYARLRQALGVADDAARPR
jgi:hypothetical protein